MKKEKGTAERQKQKRNPRIVPKLAWLNSPPTVMIEHRKESVKPMMTPSEMK